MKDVKQTKRHTHAHTHTHTHTHFNAVFSEVFRVSVSHNLGRTQLGKTIARNIQNDFCNNFVRTLIVNNKILAHHVSILIV